MSAALALQRIEHSKGPNAVTKRVYKVTLTSTYAAQSATPKEVIDFTKATNPNNLPQLVPGRNPTSYAIEGQPVGLMAKIIPGTTISNWSLQMFYSQAADNEFVEKVNAEAYTAGTLADTNFLIQVSAPVSM